MERRKVRLDNQPVDFTGFPARTGKPVRFTGSAKKLSFVMEPTLPLPHKVVTDLCPSAETGSCRTPHQQRREVYRRGRLRCAFALLGDILHFEVEDSGIGIPQRNRIRSSPCIIRLKTTAVNRRPVRALDWRCRNVWRKVWAGISPLPASRVKGLHHLYAYRHAPAVAEEDEENTFKERRYAAASPAHPAGGRY